MKASESIDNHSKSLYFKFQADISKNAPVGIFLNLPETGKKASNNFRKY